jgi:hypothetical protein
MKQDTYVANILYDVGLYYPKASLISFYWRLIPPSFITFRRILWFIVIYTTASALTVFFLELFWCYNGKSDWFRAPDCTSFDSLVVFKIIWSLDISSDVIIFALPFFLLKYITATRAQAIGLVSTFLLGGITIAISVVRFASLNFSFEGSVISMLISLQAG